jgi:ElaB/YqjD/DUF883 family membrane-anchored ribosome-binding protein
MANSPQNRSKTQSSGTASAGMRVSGEEIFREPETEMHRVSEEEVKAAFGQTADTEAKKLQPSEQQKPSSTVKQAGEISRGSESDAAQTAANTIGAAADTAKDVLKKAGTATSQTLGQVQDKAETVVSKGKQTIAEGLTGIAEGIRQFGNTLQGGEQPNRFAAQAAQYVTPLAGQLENIADYIERRDIRGLTRDLKSFARRNPTLFVAAAFGVGLFAARFLKASPNRALTVRNQNNFSNLEGYSDISNDKKSARHGAIGGSTPPQGTTIQ